LVIDRLAISGIRGAVRVAIVTRRTVRTFVRRSRFTLAINCRHILPTTRRTRFEEVRNLRSGFRKARVGEVALRPKGSAESVLEVTTGEAITTFTEPHLCLTQVICEFRTRLFSSTVAIRDVRFLKPAWQTTVRKTESGA